MTAAQMRLARAMLERHTIEMTCATFRVSRAVLRHCLELYREMQAPAESKPLPTQGDAMAWLGRHGWNSALPARFDGWRHGA